LNESKKTKDFDSKKSQPWQYYLGGVVWWKKPEVKNLMPGSLQACFSTGQPHKYQYCYHDNVAANIYYKHTALVILW
jgi:hypothetical protein